MNTTGVTEAGDKGQSVLTNEAVEPFLKHVQSFLSGTKNGFVWNSWRNLWLGTT